METEDIPGTVLPIPAGALGICKKQITTATESVNYEHYITSNSLAMTYEIKHRREDERSEY